MHKLILIFSVLFLCTSCEKESYLRLESNENLENFIPDYSKPKRFRSNLNDTVEIRLLSYRKWFEKVPASLDIGGSLPDYDYVEAGNILQVLGCDTPFIRLTYSQQTEYKPQSASRTLDKLTINYEDEHEESSLVFLYADSLDCISERCIYADGSFKLQNRSFTNVYLTRRDSVSITALYVNEANGVIGFRTSENKIFELIP